MLQQLEAQFGERLLHRLMVRLQRDLSTPTSLSWGYGWKWCSYILKKMERGREGERETVPMSKGRRRLFSAIHLKILENS